jgi:hypothetical protein
MIDVEVELTANHRGHFQLKICPVGRGETEATQAIRESMRGRSRIRMFETGSGATKFDRLVTFQLISIFEPTFLSLKVCTKFVMERSRFQTEKTSGTASLGQSNPYWQISLHN